MSKSYDELTGQIRQTTLILECIDYRLKNDTMLTSDPNKLHELQELRRTFEMKKTADSILRHDAAANLKKMTGAI